MRNCVYLVFIPVKLNNWLLENTETRNGLISHLSQITDLTLATNNLTNETSQLRKMNVGLQINLENISTTLGDKSAQLDAVANDLLNKTSFLLTVTSNIDRQEKHLENLSSSFEITFCHFTNLTDSLFTNVNNLEESSKTLLNKTEFLENNTIRLFTGIGNYYLTTYSRCNNVLSSSHYSKLLE